MAIPTNKMRFLKPQNNEKYDLQTLTKNFDSIDEAFGNMGAARPYTSSLAVGNAVADGTHSVLTALEYRAQKFGNWAWIKILCEVKAGQTIVRNQYGALASSGDGLRVVTVKPEWLPLIATPLGSSVSGRGLASYISPNGGVELNFAAGTTDLGPGTFIYLFGWYMLGAQ